MPSTSSSAQSDNSARTSIGGDTTQIIAAKLSDLDIVTVLVCGCWACHPTIILRTAVPVLKMTENNTLEISSMIVPNNVQMHGVSVLRCRENIDRSFTAILHQVIHGVAILSTSSPTKQPPVPSHPCDAPWKPNRYSAESPPRASPDPTRLSLTHVPIGSHGTHIAGLHGAIALGHCTRMVSGFGNILLELEVRCLV